jgi:hypothetical protein
MSAKLIIDLAEGGELGDALAKLGDWYGRRGVRSHRVWVKIGTGNQDAPGGYAFAWPVANIDVQDS